jgi:hypothetical protein
MSYNDHLSDDIPRMVAATRTLAHLGYTYEGGEQWKPPLKEALLPPPVSDYQRGHMAGYKWAIQSISDLLTMWSKPHPSKVSIESILTESQR